MWHPSDSRAIIRLLQVVSQKRFLAFANHGDTTSTFPKPSSLTLFVPKQVAVIVLTEIAHQFIITHAGIYPTLFESMTYDAGIHL